MSEVKELVSKYRWWILGVIVVGLVVWNNYGVAQAEATPAVSTETTMEDTPNRREAYRASQRAKRAELSDN